MDFFSQNGLARADALPESWMEEAESALLQECLLNLLNFANFLKKMTKKGRRGPGRLAGRVTRTVAVPAEPARRAAVPRGRARRAPARALLGRGGRRLSLGEN